MATLPGWRDFERACAATFSGLAVESKFFVDVIFPLDETRSSFYGIDCKMRRELRNAHKKGIITVEVTNAANYLWNQLELKGITKSNFRDMPDRAGSALIAAMDKFKRASSSEYPEGPIATDSSYYFVLLWDKQGNYQLFQLPLSLPEPDELTWECHVRKKRNGAETTRLVGHIGTGKLYEWYGDSGGQFKFFPHVNTAIWHSEVFRLEPLPHDTEKGLVARAKNYFPEKWSRTFPGNSSG